MRTLGTCINHFSSEIDTFTNKKVRSGCYDSSHGSDKGGEPDVISNKGCEFTDNFTAQYFRRVHKNSRLGTSSKKVSSRSTWDALSK